MIISPGDSPSLLREKNGNRFVLSGTTTYKLLWIKNYFSRKNKWENEYQNKQISIDSAAALIESGQTVGMSCGPSLPVDILDAIGARKDELEDVTILSGLLMPPVKPRKTNHLEADYKGHIRHVSIFLGAFERPFLKEGNIDLIAFQFSNADTFYQNRYPIDIAILECSPPDKDGFMSFGPCGMLVNHIWVKMAKKIVVQVNDRTPYIYGSKSSIHVNDVDYICESSHELPVPLNRRKVSTMEETIASYIIDQIPDGSTIQLGVGGISNAVGFLLKNKNDLGIHTEMLTDSMVALAQKGVVNGSRKTFHPHKILFAFGAGERTLYDFIDNNQDVECAPISYVNDVYNIAKNDHLISINNTLSVDLTGQVCSETIGFNQYSGTGGQVDFVRGAQLSKEGKSFITLQSTAKTDKGLISRINTSLFPGTVVTTPRTDVQYVVTEYGIADLQNKCVRDRATELIKISHPDFRDALTEEAKQVV